MITSDNHTGDKFSAGINNTSEQLSPVTMTLVINLLPVTGEQKSPRGVDSSEQCIAGVADTGDKLLISVIDTSDKLFSSVVDTGDNISLVSLIPVINNLKA